MRYSAVYKPISYLEWDRSILLAISSSAAIGENMVVDMRVLGHILGCMAKKNNSRMTIGDLAEMIQRTMASKEDVTRIESLQRNMLEELNATHEDVRYVRNTVSTLVHSDAAHEAAIAELKSRVSRVEQKVGLAR